MIALVGVLRHREHRSVPEIHALLRRRGLEIAERSVTNLLDRYDELLATGLTGMQRLRRLLKPRGGVILALDGLQPDVGHEVLWVARDCLSGAVLLARILGNAAGETADTVRRRFDDLIRAMTCHRAEAGSLVGAVEHFLKVTRSYRPGRFHCYAVAGLPRTNNDLEQMFGSQRDHERRATGRKTASPALVLRGEVRLIAATVTRLHPPTARDLGQVSLERWRDLRLRLEQRRLARTRRTRFRRDPDGYLAALEQKARQQALPA